GKQHDPEQGPSAINVLRDEVVLLRQIDLVREREKMRPRWHQRQCREADGKELHDLRGQHGSPYSLGKPGAMSEGSVAAQASPAARGLPNSPAPATVAL